VGIAQNAWLDLLGAKDLQPSQAAAQNQQAQQKEGAPKQAQLNPKWRLMGGSCAACR
jgi:hypothetical protein